MARREKHFLTVGSQQTNVEGMIELEKHLLATAGNVIIDSGKNHQMDATLGRRFEEQNTQTSSLSSSPQDTIYYKGKNS